jgi:hypothetical protein
MRSLVVSERTQQIQQVSLKVPNLPPVLYRIQKADGDFELCFEPPVVLREISEKMAKDGAYCSESRPDHFKVTGDEREEATPRFPGLSFKNVQLGEEIAEELNHSAGISCKENVKTKKSKDDDKLLPCSTYRNVDFTKSVQLEFIARSTEGVIYYLGEAVRQQLYPDPRTRPRIVYIRDTNSQDPLPPSEECLAGGRSKGPLPQSCKPIFVLKNEIHESTPMFPIEPTPILPNEPTSILAVSYDGEDYAVPAGYEAGKTTEVLSIVTQLIGLHKSAKSLPTSSVFTLVGP